LVLVSLPDSEPEFHLSFTDSKTLNNVYFAYYKAFLPLTINHSVNYIK